MRNFPNLYMIGCLMEEHDLGAAKTLIEHAPDYTDIICFHCQQAVEKSIKAYLTFKEISFQKSHDLNYLWELVDDEKIKSEDIYKPPESSRLQSIARPLSDRLTQISTRYE